MVATDVRKEAQTPCRFLDWDSEFFGMRIGRVVGSKLTAPDAARALDWLERESIDCLYYLASSGDMESIRVAESADFRLTDIRITLARELATIPTDGTLGVPGVEVGPFAQEEVSALRALARESHSASRFYGDPKFPRERCDALYERWIEKSCSGFADTVLVARHEGAAKGYLSCHLDPDAIGRIGLVAVGKDAQERSLGSQLLQSALAWFGAEGCQRVVVATQGNNTQGLRLYENAGFRIRSVQIWYHLWRTDLEAKGSR
jgi:GNAT superfamily N-acetyltransferase